MGYELEGNVLKDYTPIPGVSPSELMAALWNIKGRSITGPGLRDTLKVLAEHMPLHTAELRTGTAAFDWTVPKEWRFISASLKDPNGNIIFDTDAGDSDLHVLGYSTPYEGVASLGELMDHVVVGPENLPDAIPYTTSYYKRRWGLNLSYNQEEALGLGGYTVKIDTVLADGQIDFADLVIPRTPPYRTEGEIWLMTYPCHMQTANDNLSSLVVMVEVVKWLLAQPSRKHEYRIVIAPETIGPLAYLSGDDSAQRHSRKMQAGIVLSCMGGPGNFDIHMSRSRNYSDKVARRVLADHTNGASKETGWAERKSDERQYGARGIEFPVCTIMKTAPGDMLYPEYHTSADDLSYVTGDQLAESVDVVTQVLRAFERDDRYLTTTRGEPVLTKHGLIETLSQVASSDPARALLGVYSLCDFDHTSVDIAAELKMEVAEVQDLLDTLLSKELVVAL